MTTETEAQTTDTYTDSRGARFIAGHEVPEPVWIRHHQVLDAHEATAERLTEERDLWRTLAEARGGVLAAHRTGGRVPGKHIDAARAAQDRLTELGADR